MISEHGKMTNEPETNVNEFWDLMRQLICYENRLSASLALAHPFFAQFIFLECVVDRPEYCRFEVIGDGNIILRLNLSETPMHSMQSFRRSSDDRYTLKLTCLKTKKIVTRQDVKFRSRNIVYLNQQGNLAKKV